MNIKQTITKMEFVSIIETKLQVIRTSGRSAMQGTNGCSLLTGGGGGQEIPGLQVLCSLGAGDADPDSKENRVNPGWFSGAQTLCLSAHTRAFWCGLAFFTVENQI